MKTKTGVRQSTKQGYVTVQRLLAKETFGKKTIRSVKTSDAKLFLIKLQQEDGKSYSSIHTIRGVLRPAFQMAVDDDILVKNPFGFQLAGVLVNDAVTREVITKDQMRKFLKFVHDDVVYYKYYEVVYILFHTGMRISEFCGLTLKDIDLENRTVNIDHQLQRTSDMRYIIETTKTDAGDEDIPSDCFIRHQKEGIDIICSNIGLAGTEVQLVNAMSREYVLKQILYGIKDQYDAVIIDCMPSLGMITINALAASDEVLIPVEASYLPIKGLQQLLKTIGKVRKQINPKLQVGGILFTMVDAHTNDARNNMELLRNVYGSQIHIFDNYIPFSVRMKEAVREGQSIFSYDPKGKATEAYRRVTEEVLKDAI